jgi:signal transduction histidine kinase
VEDLLTDEQVIWHLQGAALLAWKKNDIHSALLWWDQAIKLGEGRDDLLVAMISVFHRRCEALREFKMFQLASDAAQEWMAWINQRNVQQQKMLSAGIRELVNVAVLQSENKILNENKSFLEKKVAERTQELQNEIEIRKHAELALQESNEQLEMRVLERTRDLHAAMDALAQKETLASLGRLVAGVAHELNTPIGNALLSDSLIAVLNENFSTSIKAGSITRSSLNAMLNEIQIGIDINERALHRASDLVERFKEIAVLHQGETQQEFNLHSVLEYELARLHPNAQQTMVLECPSDLMCTNYLIALGKVIHHLLSNALSHGLAGQPGKIILRAQQQNSDLILEVQDNGVGFEADLLTKIFTPFYTTAIGQGHVCLGLYMVHNICTGLLGGSLNVESQLGQGSFF